MQVGGSGPTGVDTVSESSGLDAVELTWKGRGSLRLVLALALGALGWPAFRLGLSGVLGVITQQVPAEDLLFDAPALARRFELVRSVPMQWARVFRIFSSSTAASSEGVHLLPRL